MVSKHRNRTGWLGWVGVTDAYEESRGRLVIKLGGIVPVKKIAGPDPTNTTVDLDIGEDDRPLRCRAGPATIGRQIVCLGAPWFGTCSEFREWEGFNVASRVEAGWDLPDGPFVYFRSEITSFTCPAVRTPCTRPLLTPSFNPWRSFRHSPDITVRGI